MLANLMGDDFALFNPVAIKPQRQQSRALGVALGH